MEKLYGFDRGLAIMCSSIECKDCRIAFRNNGTHMDCRKFVDTHPGYAVQMVIKWMDEQKHTKPQIRTWKDWQRVNFPDADAIIEPCMFASRAEIGCDGNCRGCCLKPIPAKYAEKFGIKPMEGTGDE